MYKSKAVGPVVAVALLLVIGVLAVIGFQTWFGTYTSGLFSNVETQSKVNSLIFNDVIGDNLYIKSDGYGFINFFKIVDGNGNILCEFKDGVKTDLGGYTNLLMNFNNETFNGTHVLDLSKYNNLGLVNSASYVEANCVNGGCFNFDGADDYIFLDNKSSLMIAGPQTISAWINPDEIDNDHHIIYARNNAFTTSGIAFSASYNHLYSNIRFINDSVYSIVGFGDDLQLSKLSHVVLVWDGRFMKHYINGKLKNTVDFLININVKTDFTQDSYIGARNPTTYMFDGTIDELSIYSKAITEDEIKLLYNKGEAKFYEQLLTPGLVNIDISDCNLVKGHVYDIIAFTDSIKIDERFILR